MKFTKMQGIGNDYVYVNCFEEEVKDPAAAARFVSDRHFGIGSDGLILIRPSKTADCRMDMYNADGSPSSMCGNGIRCVGKYAYDHAIVTQERISVETESGIKYLDLYTERGQVQKVRVDMGEAMLTSEVPQRIEVNGKNYSFIGISMGNPHAVLFLDEIDSLDLEKTGPGFENHPFFPDRTNTEFMQILDRTHMKMRVWERGSGETLACGTGACAGVAAAVLAGYTEREVTVSLLGGDLQICCAGEDLHIYMTGPAVEVFRGEIDF